MDIKGKIDEVVNKIKNDKDFAAKFQSNPVQALESIVGIDLPEDQVNSVIEGVKAKLSLDKADGLLGQVKKLF